MATLSAKFDIGSRGVSGKKKKKRKRKKKQFVACDLPTRLQARTLPHCYVANSKRLPGGASGSVAG
jgi:hypothetical protein